MALGSTRISAAGCSNRSTRRGRPGPGSAWPSSRASSRRTAGQPLSPTTDLAPAIALARRHFDEMQALRRESADLRQALEDRKVIERAKEVVAHRVAIPEAEAYRRMRRLASNENRKLIEVARQLLAAEEVF